MTTEVKNKLKTVGARTIEGGTHGGGWYFVITTFINFLRDVIPASVPESGLTCLGAILVTVLSGLSTAKVHNIQKNKVKKGK